MAVAVRQPDGTLTAPDELETEWRDNLTAAWEYRKQFEPTWLSNFAFAKGQHWQVWDPDQKKMRHLSEVDPRFEQSELVGADKINEHVVAQLGELEAATDRPELLTTQEGETAEEIAHELNDVAAHCWEHEWNAVSRLDQVDRLTLTLGTAAIRVRSEPTRTVAGYQTLDAQGNEVKDPAALAQLEQAGRLPDGSLPNIQPVYERRTVWEPLSAFNILVPPGINHEDWLPWEAIMRPVLLDDVKAEYPAAKDLVEDSDIGSLLGISTNQTAAAGDRSPAKGRLRKHVWLFTVFVRPCPKYPDGQQIVLGSGQMKLLDAKPGLDYETPSKEPRSGIHYFHWWRNADTFYSRGFIEPLKDPQRIINRRETQMGEIIDRGMPKAFVKEGALVHNPAGLPLEVVELKPDADEPHFFAGLGPGDWFHRDLERQADNLAHASTLSQLRLGENPPNVLTLGQLSLLNENESAKRSKILKQREQSIDRCVEDSLVDVQRYWPKEKRILVEGDEGQLREQIFDKSRIPALYVVRTAKGSAKPRSQGAELTKVDAIWNAAVACGVATGPNADKWIEWYAKSLDAGQALDLPEAPADAQADMARFENFLMLDEGEDVEPSDYDLLPVHVPIHREAENQARAAGDLGAVQRIRAHIDRSQMLVAQNAALVNAAQQTPSPAPGPTPPAPGAPLLPPPGEPVPPPPGP